jgi:hypothetical protein
VWEHQRLYNNDVPALAGRVKKGEDRGGLREPGGVTAVPIYRIDDSLTMLFKYSLDSH